LKAERKREAETRKEEWFATERTYGRFACTVQLPEGVTADDVKATFVNGVLEVTMPLAAVAAPPAARKIAIGDGATTDVKAPEKGTKAVA